MRRLLMVALMALPGWVSGQEHMRCPLIDSDTERLACYDSYIPPRKALSRDDDISDFGSWTVTEKVDAFNDQTQITAYTDTVSGLGCNRLSGGALIIRCRGTELNMYVKHGCYAPGTRSGWINVDQRVDGGAAITKNLYPDSTDRAFGEWNSRSAAIWLNQIGDGTKLLLRFTPYRETPETLEFDVTGIGAVRSRMSAQCIGIELSR